MHTPPSMSLETKDIIAGELTFVGKADYWRSLAMNEPDQPGGRVVCSTADYETQEEEDAAFEAFVNQSLGEPMNRERDSSRMRGTRADE